MVPAFAIVTWSCGLTSAIIFNGETAEEAFEYIWHPWGPEGADYAVTVAMFWKG